MNNWQRVSPIAILYFIASTINLLLSNIIYMVPLVVTTYNTALENPLWLFLGASVFIVLLGLSAFLQYYFFRFRLSDQTIEIKSGVFKKIHLNLPFTRIQNVKIITPFYFRPFDYTTLELDTAGSAKSEAKIVALELTLSAQLKNEILTHAQPKSSNDAIPNAEMINDEVVLNRRSLKDLVIHGITNNRIWIFFALLAPLIGPAANKADVFLVSIGLNVSEMFSPATHAWWQLGLYGAALLILSYFIVVAFSVFGSIIAFYGYTLSKQGSNYIRRSGLLTRHEVVMKLPRLQLVISQQDWLDILINRINLRFEQTNNQQHQQANQEIRNKIMVPSISQLQFDELLSDVWPNSQLNGLNFSRISKRFMAKNIILICLLPTIGIGALLYNQQWQIALIVLAAITLLSSLVCMRWYRWGYAMDDNFIYIRKGVLGVNYYIFPLHKVQQAKFHQSVLMARRELASISLVLASGVQKIPFMPQQAAHAIINKSLYIVEFTKRNWM